MRLYIDLEKLYKAQQQSGAGKDTPLEEQGTKEYENTYSRRYEGVAAGEAYDPSDDEVDEDDEDKKKDTEIKKTLSAHTSSNTDMLKSLNARLEEFNRANTPNPTEVKFLEEQGYATDDIIKGRVVMNPRMRRLFTEWLCDRLSTSVDDLLPRR